MKDADFGGPNPPDELKRTPAEIDEQIEGSEINEDGSAEDRASARSIKFSDPFMEALRTKKKAYDDEFGDRYGDVSINELKAVARRGMGAYSSSHHPDASRTSWALGRVNAYLNLRANGEPEKENYTQDNDLLPDNHPAKSVSDDKVDEVYERYQEVVGLSVEQAEEWVENPCHEEASGDDGEKHIRRNIYILETDKSDWPTATIPEDLALNTAESRKVLHQAQRTIAFYERHNNGEHSDFISRECPHSRKEVALWNWLINEFEGRPIREDFSYLGGLGELKPIVSRQGGKYRSREKLVEHLPEHDTYIEPFFGGGSVFFYKKPAETSVISDTDRNLMAMYQAVPNVDFSELDFSRSEDEWETYRDKFKGADTRAYESDKNQVRNYIYWRSYSYGNKGSQFDGKREYKAKFLKDHSWEYRKRLYHTRVLSQDYKKVVEKYDGKNAAIYLDPPYPGTDQRGYQENAGIDTDRLLEVCQGIEGKFLLSLPWDKELREKFSEFNQKGMFVRYSINDKDTSQRKKELLVSNYNL